MCHGWRAIFAINISGKSRAHGPAPQIKLQIRAYPPAVAVEQGQKWRLLIILNTVGGDVEAGWRLPK